MSYELIPCSSGLFERRNTFAFLFFGRLHYTLSRPPTIHQSINLSFDAYYAPYHAIARL